MQTIRLDLDERVVLDVGHSGRVVAAVMIGQSIVTGATDGHVFIRDLHGASLVAPVHLPEVTCLAQLGTSELCLIGTEGRTHAVNVETGKHVAIEGLEDTSVRAALPHGDGAMVGCSDGTIRSVSFDDGVRIVMANDAPVIALASLDDELLAASLDGHLRRLTPGGELRWQAPVAGGVSAVTTGHDRVLTVSADLDSEVDPAAPMMSVLRTHDGDGRALGERRLDWAVTAVASTDAGFLVACADGAVRQLGPDLADGALVAQFRTMAIEMLATSDAGTWVGTAEGEVYSIDPARSLPAHASGVLAMTFSPDQQTAVASDGRGLLRFDLTTGERTGLAPVEGISALTLAEGDLIVGHLDGRIERRSGSSFEKVVAEGRIAGRPTNLGYADGRVLVDDGSSDRWLDARDLQAAATEGDAAAVAMVVRTGFPFRGIGSSSGLQVAVIEGHALVVLRPGQLRATSDALPHLRLLVDGALLPIA